MNIALKLLTILFGLFWVVFGVNGFFHFFPIPEPSGDAAAFMNALDNAGYVMPAVYATQIFAGLLLITQRFTPLALLILAPVLANIILYDIFLNPSGLAIGAAISVIYLILLLSNRRKFEVFLKP